MYTYILIFNKVIISNFLNDVLFCLMTRHYIQFYIHLTKL